MTELRTPTEWAPLTGIVVLDPDGWDRTGREAGGRGFEEPITEAEFRERAFRSTVRRYMP